MSTETQNIDYAHKAFEQAALAFQGASWIHEAAYRQPTPVMQRAQQLQEEHTITAQDIEAIVAAAVAQHTAAGIPLAEIEKLKASLMGNIGASRSQLGEIKSQVQNAMSSLASEASERVGGVEEPTAKALIAELNELSKKAHDHFCKMDRYTTDEQKEREAKLRKAYEEAQQSGDLEATAKAAENLGKFYEHTGQEAKLKAMREGDTQGAEAAQETHEVGKKICEKSHKLRGLQDEKRLAASEHKKSSGKHKYTANELDELEELGDLSTPKIPNSKSAKQELSR